MDWQDLGVLAVVAGAVLYLVSRFVTIRRRRRQPAQTFVPLAELQKKGARQDKREGCH